MVPFCSLVSINAKRSHSSSWAVSKDLSLLQKHEIEAYINEPHKKSGDLLQGYKIAMNPREWEEKLEEQRAANEEAEANEEVDQLEDAEEEEEGEPKKVKPNAKKRKREHEPKPKKKREPKKSASAGAESKEKKAGVKKKAGKKNGVMSKETIESEDDGGEDAEGEDAPAESSKKSGPVSKRAKKDKGGDDGDLGKCHSLAVFLLRLPSSSRWSPYRRSSYHRISSRPSSPILKFKPSSGHLANNPDAVKVKEWRHKLQRAFLSRTVPKAEVRVF